MNNALELTNVSKHYPGFALEDISFSLPQGCILGLVGENGAGKSTLIRLMMNATQKDGGQISVLGVDNALPAFAAVKEDIGVVLDEAYFPDVIVADQLNSIMKLTYQNWDEALYFDYIRQFDLPKNKPFKEFSRGMRMKMGIAVSLSHGAKLLVLDEPTSGLDPIVRDEIVEIFSEFTRAESHSILISSHIVSDRENLCDYIAFLHRGRLLFCEEKDRLKDEHGLVVCTKAQMEELPREGVLGVETGAYGARCLVKRSMMPSGTPVEPVGLEDLILLLVKGEKSR